MFRADITIDYLTPVKVNGQSTAAAPARASADLDSIVGLANGYFDFEGAFPNMFGPLQPYVSAGIGVARNHLGTTTGVSPLIGPFTLGSASRMNFAWALGAGVGYALTPRLTIDLAYKYVDSGEVRNGGTLTASGASFQLTPSKTGGVGVHAVTLGFRYEIWANSSPSVEIGGGGLRAVHGTPDTLRCAKPDGLRCARGSLRGLSNIYTQGVNWKRFDSIFDLTDKLKAGIAVTVPFGKTIDYTSTWSGRYVNTKTAALTADINPNISYRISDRLSVGAGFRCNISRSNWRLRPDGNRSRKW
jgi:hypothetical protein